MYVRFCNEAKSCAYWLVNETLWYETKTFDFQSKTRSRPRPSDISTRPRRLETMSRDRLETETSRWRLQYYIPVKNRLFRFLGEPPLGQSSPEWEKIIPDSSRTRMRSFIPLSFSAAEKSITVQSNKLETVSIAEPLQNRQHAQNP